MQELGSIENVNVGRGAYVNNATPRKAVREKGGGGRQPGQNAPAVIGESAQKTAAGAAANEPKSTLRKGSVESISEAGSAVEHRGRETAISSDSQSAATLGKIDLSFGVEEMTYKNMWKVLKTVVKEIGDIKKATSGRFFLGVNKRLEKFTTLMEFGSLISFLAEQAKTSAEGVPSGAAEQIAVDPEASLQAQANVVPDTALHLLAATG